MKEKKTNVDDHRVFFTFDEDCWRTFLTNQNRGNLATSINIHRRGFDKVTRSKMESHINHNNINVVVHSPYNNSRLMYY